MWPARGSFFETKRTICVSHLRISRQAPNVQQIPLLLPTSWCIAMFVAFLRNNLHLRHLSLVKAPSHECRLPESRESAVQRQSLVLHACQRARQPPDIVSRSALREPFLHRWFGAPFRCVPTELGCVTVGFVRVLTAADWRVRPIDACGAQTHHIASHNHDHGESRTPRVHHQTRTTVL